MRLEELKKGFWGYKKECVFQYITDLDESCNQKLRERDDRAAQVEQRAQARIQALEQENSALREELYGLRNQRDEISAAILEARASAETMKAETRAREEAARDAIRRNLEEDLLELERYREKISDLRIVVRRTLEELDGQAEELERQVRVLSEALPEGNLALFQ